MGERGQLGLYCMPCKTMEPGQDNGTDRRERRCLSLQTAFTRHSPAFSFLSYLLFSLSSPSFSPSSLMLPLLRLLGSGCYKMHAERNQMTAALKTFHTNQELCFTPLPPFLTHTHSQRQQPTVDMPGWPKSFAL